VSKIYGGFIFLIQCLFWPSRSDSRVRMPRLAERSGGTFLVYCLGIEKKAKADHLKNRGIVGTGFAELQAGLGRCTEITVGRKNQGLSSFSFALISFLIEVLQGPFDQELCKSKIAFPWKEG